MTSGIASSCLTWPGTSNSWLGISIDMNRSEFFHNLWQFLVAFDVLGQLDEQLNSGVDRARRAQHGTNDGLLGIGTDKN